MQILDINTARDYATKENLLKALAKFPESWRYVIAKNDSGRYTAIFQVQSLGPDVAGAAREGFITI